MPSSTSGSTRSSVDKGVRDTGPYIDGKYYGTHPAVRVWYSPGVMRWLANGRQGPIPDGEVIIKEADGTRSRLILR